MIVKGKTNTYTRKNVQQSGLNERITERLKELQEYRRQGSDPQKQIRTIVSRKNDEQVKNNKKQRKQKEYIQICIEARAKKEKEARTDQETRRTARSMNGRKNERERLKKT